MNIRPILLLCVGIAFFGQTSCVSYTYIVRHAEKGAGNDPDLIPEGADRAVALAELLKANGISEVYSTDFNRTRQTATPTADTFGLAVNLYSSDTLQSFAARLLPLGKNRLVVGHSNTILDIARALGATPTLQVIPDDDFDNLLIVKRKRNYTNISVTLTETTYGAASPVH